MLRFFKFLFTGDWHLHDWETINSGPLIDEWGNTHGRWYDLRCKHCGNIKRKVV